MQTENPAMSRERLPTDRESMVHKFRIDQHKFYLIVGLYPDGRPGEIFVCGRDGSTVGGLMDTVAILASVALQYGVTIEYLKSKFEGHRFAPSGRTFNPEIPEATSIPDYIFRWIDLELKKRKQSGEAAMEQS